MFGRSRFASDDDPVGPAYHQGAEFWTLVRTQAVHDPILRSYLSRRGVNPDDPYTDDIDKRNEVIRKIKPILILRDAFLDETLGRRPRKRTSLYAGEEAIYAMSEGNPRWLAGVVNDLVDVYLNRGVARGIPLIDAAMQDEVLGGASARMLAMVKHFPIGDGSSPRQALPGQADGRLHR
jgi:hypothetical protein